MNLSNFRLRFIAPAVLLCGVAAVGYALQSARDAPSPIGFTPERIRVPDVTMIDQNARSHPFHGSLTKGKTLVINFSYTTCNSICPVGNAVLARLDAQLPSDANVHLISITIDPGRDTPERMREASEKFGASPRWSWLTGEPSEIGRLLRAFNTDVANIELHDPIFLVGNLESGRFYRSLSFPDTEELSVLLQQLSS